MHGGTPNHGHDAALLCCGVLTATKLIHLLGFACPYILLQFSLSQHLQRLQQRMWTVACDNPLSCLLPAGLGPLLCLGPLPTKLPLPGGNYIILPQTSGAQQGDHPESDTDHRCSCAHCYTHCDGVLQWSMCWQAQSQGHTCAGLGQAQISC